MASTVRKRFPAQSAPHHGPGDVVAGALAFVHISHPDDLKNRQVQTRIRRHVMRNVGPSRRTGKKPSGLVAPVSLSPREVLPDDTESGGAEPEEPVPHFTRPREIAKRDTPSWALDRADALGIDLDARALELVHYSRFHDEPGSVCILGSHTLSSEGPSGPRFDGLLSHLYPHGPIGYFSLDPIPCQCFGVLAPGPDCVNPPPHQLPRNPRGQQILPRDSQAAELATGRSGTPQQYWSCLYDYWVFVSRCPSTISFPIPLARHEGTRI